MKIRQLSLAVLQNVLKRDPSAYSEEFEALWRQYLAEVAIYKSTERSGIDDEHSTAQEREETKRLADLAHFVAHCGIHYEESRKSFGPGLAQLLEERAASMPVELRRKLTQALVLARSKGLIQGPALLETIFILVRSVKRDRFIRKLVFDAVVKQGKSDWRRSRRRILIAADCKTDSTEAKIGLDVLIQLYKDNISGIRRDVGLIDALGRACCDSERPKIARTAIYFFLGVDKFVVFEGDSDSEDEENENDAIYNSATARAARDSIDYHEHSKKTRKRGRQVARQTKRAAKIARQAAHGDIDTSQPIFSAIELLSDPQILCERLLSRLRAHKDKFETRILILELVSRLAAVHKLQLLPLYSYLQRYLDPKQRQVTKLLAIFVQGCHDLVPPDELRPLARHLADRFVSDRNAPEAMALGINAITNIVNRCPALLDEPDMLGFARDLAAYSKHRNKSVVIAARSWINAVRHQFPILLRKKDRGKFADKTATPIKFGQIDADTEIAGVDLLEAYEAGTLPQDLAAAFNGEKKIDILDDDIDIDNNDQDEEEIDDDIDIDNNDQDEEEIDDDIDTDNNDQVEEEIDDDIDIDNSDQVEEEEQPRAMIGPTRILSTEDFARIRALKAKARELAVESGSQHSSVYTNALVKPSDLEGYTVKRRATIEERRAKVEAGREQFQHRLHPGGKTNAEKKRTKNYLMLQKKAQRAATSKKRSRGAPKQQLLRDKRKRRRL